MLPLNPIPRFVLTHISIFTFASFLSLNITSREWSDNPNSLHSSPYSTKTKMNKQTHTLIFWFGSNLSWRPCGWWEQGPLLICPQHVYRPYAHIPQLPRTVPFYACWPGMIITNTFFLVINTYYTFTNVSAWMINYMPAHHVYYAFNKYFLNEWINGRL